MRLTRFLMLSIFAVVTPSAPADIVFEIIDPGQFTVGITQDVDFIVRVTGPTAVPFSPGAYGVAFDKMNPVLLTLPDVVIGSAAAPVGTYIANIVQPPQDVSGTIPSSEYSVQGFNPFSPDITALGDYGLFSVPVTFNAAGSIDLVVEPGTGGFTQFTSTSPDPLGALPTLTLTAVAAVPEPSSFALCGLVALGFGVSVTRRRKRNAEQSATA